MDKQGRPLTELERQVLQKLLIPNFSGRDEIREQSKDCIAIPTGDPDNYGSIYLKTDSPVKAPVTSLVPVEGFAKDKDGAEIVIILHMDDGFIHELEFVRSDGLPMLAPINPATITVEVQ
jgi:hypothetical protein